MSEVGVTSEMCWFNYVTQNITELQAIYSDFLFLFPTLQLEQEFLISFWIASNKSMFSQVGWDGGDATGWGREVVFLTV